VTPTRSTAGGGEARPTPGTSKRALDTYRAKRRPGRTPEPIPTPATPARRRRDRAKGPVFVVQEHHARALHWDFRLERDGVLVSWALPKGLPADPGQNHLAVHTEDHPLEYGAFEGTIPAGEYGGGEVSIWDHGVYECETWTEREVKVVLHGTRAEGRYVLFRTGRGERDWMIHRMDPAPAGWTPLPETLRPMLATTGPLPKGPGWSFELKWDGVRALVFVDGGRVKVLSRNERDVTASYPELRGLGLQLGSRQALLDGEIVALDADGRPSFGLLQQRMHVVDAARARRLAEQVPATYMAFDLLQFEGHPTVELSYDERRHLLEGLALQGSSWATPPAFVDVPGADVQRAARQRSLEGVVAKRRSSSYRPGRRSDDWVKVKDVRTQEVVIGGWSAGQGRRRDKLGALLVGVPEDGGLRYVGKVGTGFGDAALADLRRRLDRRRRVRSPFVGAVPASEAASATWVKPDLVGEVGFGEWTGDGRLRHPRWRGLRPDKTPDEVVVEP
jgi:bifunctional non-homologous end joining protein LigD